MVHIHKTFLICLMSFLFIVISPLMLSGGELLQNGNYHPGVVLVYINNKWMVATPATVSPGKDTYVFIHGAHNTKKQKPDVITEAIKECRPNSNVLAVDWSHWGSFNAEHLARMIQEQFQDWMAVTAIHSLTDNIFDSVFNQNAILIKHLDEFFIRVLLNVFPAEQTNYIPVVARRVEHILFATQHSGCVFKTDNEKNRFLCLGLKPEKTHLIGHSHGAHIAGLIGVQAKVNKHGTVKKITALDPSTPEIHISKENNAGKGWDRHAARYLDVYRTSLICSSDKLYGHYNVHWFKKDHPKLQINNIDILGNPIEALAIITGTIVTDIDLHMKVSDYYAAMIKKDKSFLDEIKQSDSISCNKWIIYEY